MPTRTPAPSYLGTEYYSTGPIGDKYDGYKGSWSINAGLGGHYGYPDFPKDRDVGGALLIQGDRVTYDPVPVGKIWRGGPLGQYYIGSITAATPDYAGTVPYQDGYSRGAEAFAKMRPDRPKMQLANSIAELKDLKASLTALEAKFVTNGLKEVGSFFLALQFGWQPIFEDVVNFFYQHDRIQKKVDFLLRNNGKSVRTSLQLASTSDVQLDATGSLYTAFTPGFVTQYYRTQPRYRNKFEVFDRTWARARWRIFLPEPTVGPVTLPDALLNHLYGNTTLVERLYGNRITPASVWKLIPWSWLADWVFNVGYILENLQATYDSRTAAEYCYIMREVKYRRTYSVQGSFSRQDGTAVPVSSASIRENFVKTRIRSNPFGFAAVVGSPTAMQTAILGALGLSKLS